MLSSLRFYILSFLWYLLVSCFIHAIGYLFFPLTKNDPWFLLLYIFSYLLYYMYSFYLLVRDQFDYLFCHPVIFLFDYGLLCVDSCLNIPPHFLLLRTPQASVHYYLYWSVKYVFLLVLGKFLLFRFWHLSPTIVI